MFLSQGYSGVISEINAIDAVMHYALKKLRFPLNQIVIFAWSIGGYSACWTAVHYQNIRGLILDATFDDILPLAQRQMPVSLSNFVEKTIRFYLDLNNIQLLKHYQGPFYLIRRTRDEVMNLIPDQVSSNRANDLLLSILLHRYPSIFHNDEILSFSREYLSLNRSAKSLFYDRFSSDRDQWQYQINLYRLRRTSPSYPCHFGKSIISGFPFSFSFLQVKISLSNNDNHLLFISSINISSISILNIVQHYYRNISFYPIDVCDIFRFFFE